MSIKILVPDMHCEHCVKRIDAALNEVGLNFTVSLEDKCVIIDGCHNCANTALTEIEDLGFTPEIVE